MQGNCQGADSRLIAMGSKTKKSMDGWMAESWIEGWGQRLGGYFQANATEIAATKCPLQTKKARSYKIRRYNERGRKKAREQTQTET